MATLDEFYNQRTGLWDATGWWNSANALETTIDYTSKTGDKAYLSRIANTFAKNCRRKFLNEFYDDEGWWALAWIKAFDLTRYRTYLDAARTIFGDMVRGWDEACGGGIWWKKQHVKKNAIPNELFISVAARLAQRTAESAYLNWARRAWEWFSNSGLINASNLINDGLTATCENDGGVTWTYNQGVILGALVALRECTNDESFLVRAQAIADAALAALTDHNGVLHEPNEPNLGADGPQFKGIFMRNLCELYTATRKPVYRDAAIANADAVWESSRNDANAFGGIWTGPFDLADASRQSAALDALNAAISFDGQW